MVDFRVRIFVWNLLKNRYVLKIIFNRNTIPARIFMGVAINTRNFSDKPTAARQIYVLFFFLQMTKPGISLFYFGFPSQIYRNRKGVSSFKWFKFSNVYSSQIFISSFTLVEFMSKRNNLGYEMFLKINKFLILIPGNY